MSTVPDRPMPLHPDVSAEKQRFGVPFPKGAQRLQCFPEVSIDLPQGDFGVNLQGGG